MNQFAVSSPAPAQRLQRSELAVPATSTNFFKNAAASAADAIFLDLEDAVAPSRKEEARAAAVEALNGMDWGNKTVAVRINGLDSAWAYRDIVEVVTCCPRLDLVLVPKVGSAFDVAFVDQLLTLLEREIDRPRPVGIEVLIETALGVAHVEEIAAASPRLEAMIFGVGDYSVDVRSGDREFGTPNPNYAMLTGTPQSEARERHWNDQWHFALARIANACRAYGLRAIDGPFTNFRDEAGFRASAMRAAALGFEGKWAIHPSQVDAANEAFSPDPQQVAWARETLDALDAAARQGRGAVAVNGVLVDLAHAKIARHTLDRLSAIERFSNGRAAAS